MRFESIEEINKPLVIAYTKEAIENQKLGKELKSVRTTKKDLVIPELITKETKANSAFSATFRALTLSCQLRILQLHY